MYLGVGNHFYHSAIKSEKEKKILENNKNLTEWSNINPKMLKKEEKDKQDFLMKVQPKQVTIQSSKKERKLKLVADYYNNPSSRSKWVVVAHAYSSQAADMVLWIKEFYSQGFNVLAIDLRGHGRSEGDYIGMGWDERLDIIQWLDWIILNDAQAEIALFGLSMGAAAVMMASGENLPDNVKVVVEDCGYSSTIKLFSYQIKELGKFLPVSLILHAGNTVTKIRAGYDLTQANPVEQLKKNSKPVLFIHGDQDTFVPFKMLAENYRATNAEKDYLIIHGAGHANCRRVNPELYWSTIKNFLNRYIP